MTIDAADPAAAFPWKEPWHAELWWGWDQMHWPQPVTPYTATTEAGPNAAGITAGFNALGLPMTLLMTELDGYMYLSSKMPEGDPTTWMEAARGKVVGALIGLLDTWRNTYLPEVLDLNGRLRDFDYAGATADELIAQMEEARRIRERAWDIHMRVVVPVMFAATEFANQWAAAFGEERRAEAHVLLGGFPNKTVESGAALWRLGRIAAATPAVAEIVRTAPVRRLHGLLRANEACRDFAAQFDAYLREYGWRSGGFEYAESAWIEDPTTPLITLRGYIDQPDEMDPALHAERAAAERESLLARVGPEIDALPQGPILRMTLGAAQQYLPIQEDHNFYIDQMNTVLMRLPALEAGRRLTDADALGAPEDVFYLEAEEVVDALRDPRAREWAALVVERRERRARQAAQRPPRNAGTPPPPELEALRVSGPFASFFGEPIEQDAGSNVLRGTSASRGAYTGVACVAHTLEDAQRLQPGQVLVCEMTMPAWTPLFAVAAAVVTESGGALSHSAIVAREYGLPCVVGATDATRRVRDGQTVTVDGTAGTVTILE